MLLDYTNEHGDRAASQWIALGLVDGTAERGWSSKKNAPFPHEFLFELAQTYEIGKVGFDTRKTENAEFPGISARNVEVLASTVSRDGPFENILALDMAANRITRFAFITPFKARWLKLVITGNWGHAEYTELMEFMAYGEPVGGARRSEVEPGVYETNWDLFYMQVENGQLKGCYDHDGGRFSGALKGGFLTIEWREVDPDQIGKAVLAITQDGSYFNGFWYEKGELKGTWYGPRTTKKGEPACAQALRTSTGSQVGDALNATGRAVLYGIYFDHDSDVLKSRSVTTLAEVESWLKKNPDKRVMFEGHTDADGTDAYNRDLSGRRADAVLQWIARHGIDMSRLTATGHGETQPVADNSSPQGKALNRRVEIRVTN
ncbi:MAG: OmpA family protein [Hyphomicrobiales bacterium]